MDTPVQETGEALHSFKSLVLGLWIWLKKWEDCYKMEKREWMS